MCVFTQRCITRAKHRLHWRYLILRRINRHVNSRPSLPPLTIKKLARKELILSRLTTSSLKSFLLAELSTPPSIVLDKVFSTLTFPLVQKLLFQRVIFFSRFLSTKEECDPSIFQGELSPIFAQVNNYASAASSC